MKKILQQELRKHVNRYELLGDRSSMIMAAMILTTLLNMDIDDNDVNID